MSGLAVLSHDLHNNLDCIGLHLSLLKQRLAGLPEFEEECRVLDRAELSIQHTVDGMRRLLMHESLGNGQKKPKWQLLDLGQLIEYVTSQFREPAARKGLELVTEVRCDAPACGDADLVVLVMQNLVGNAIKYSNKGKVLLGYVELASNEGDPGCELCVSDEGPGIEQVHLDHIFQAFRRGSTHGQAGVGLGLSIASRAAKLLGAKLSVESEVGVGSSFKLLFPPSI